VSFLPGQKVIATNEPELGLGIILKPRGEPSAFQSVVEVYFTGSETRRRYAAKSAPLKRFRLEPGQNARLKDGRTLRVTEVEERDGILHYGFEGEPAVPEYELHHELEIKGALEKLFLGQVSPPMAFDLRESSWKFFMMAHDPELRGLRGPRVELLPHQLSLAYELARREPLRALLSDEVGLGKTIEASLIFSLLRSLGKAEKVLVIVPEALQVQWLSELFRRFNETFHILTDASEVGEDLSEVIAGRKKIITHFDFALGKEGRFLQLLEAKFDLVIVDEAHHLDFDLEDPGPQFMFLQEMSRGLPSLLLLTATPEANGEETLFGLLNLLEPERFAKFEDFLKDQKKGKRLARIAEALAKGELSKTERAQVQELFPGDNELAEIVASAESNEQANENVLKALIDRHGTGRVFVRNRRERVLGFTKRILHPEKLTGGEKEKLAWLKKFLQAKGREKTLLICSTQKEVLRLKEFLEKEVASKKAFFHEGMELIERDRQAAYFADPTGASLLVTSEIGGEGRNFQFASQLVLWDLPWGPDLVEQRIGRLDRIGQKKPVEIFVPFLPASREEFLFQVFNEVFHSFSATWNGGSKVWENFSEEAREVVGEPKKWKSFTARLAVAVAAALKTQEEGRDILLDLNSYNESRGRLLVENIRAEEGRGELFEFMEKAFDYYGLEVEDLDSNSRVEKITAHSLMFVESFPGFENDDEKLITYSRELALAREELTFLTPEHPLVEGVHQLIRSRGEGETSIAQMSRFDLPPEMRGVPMLFEFAFVCEIVAPARFEVERFLKPRLQKVYLDPQGKTYTDLKLSPKPHPEEDKLRGQLAKLRSVLPALVEKYEKVLEAQLATDQTRASTDARNFLQGEVERLEALRRKNRLVTERDINLLRKRLERTLESIEAARYHLDAVRMILF